jgi:3D (Asp-Asp-Asp) domain-containing protein
MLVMNRFSQDGFSPLSARAASVVARRGSAQTDIMPWIFALAAVAVSAIITKEIVVRSGSALPNEADAALVDVRDVRNLADMPTSASDAATPPLSPPASVTFEDTLVGPPVALMNDYVEPFGPPAMLSGGFAPDPALRWFDARPVKPARVIWMTVTAYSPDPRSCGDSADGITATLHCVTTNGHHLVAADPKILSYGSMLTIPGYAIGAGAGPHEPAIVPVLDCGGAIKGYRLDVLFPTHEEAIAWGVRELPVTVWAYADGGGHTNPRKVR